MRLEQVQEYKRLIYDAQMIEMDISSLMEEYNLACQPLYIPGMPLDRIPGGSWPSDRAGNMAVRMADGSPPEKALPLLYAIRAKEKALAAKKRSIKTIETWLSMLPEREKWVVMNHIIENTPWRLLIYKYRCAYGEVISIDTLKRLQHKAFEKG